MQRRAWFELHDHRFFPGFLRNLVTDALQAMWNAQDTYGLIVPRLQRALREAGTNRVVDLCSGGGGPWLRLSQDFAEGGTAPEICLTDIYPNWTAFERLRAEADVEFHSEPVNAMRIPGELAGFRTIFSSFHHFCPQEARAILKDAFDQRQGIAVFESATLEMRTLLAIFFLIPLLTLWLAPRIRPFRWSRLFYTYLVPVIPFTLWLDGLLSCLRSYSHADFEELVSALAADDYRWDVGIERGRLVGVAYLVGYPLRRDGAEPAAEDVVLSSAETRKPAPLEAVRAS
jgi:hypothetical protein